MAKWSDGYVNANGLRLHYYRTGGNKPQVVINHGAGDDGLCWTHVVKEMERDYDVLLPDARGHGKSASGKGDYSTCQRVADLAGLIKALKLDRPVVGGHSMGAETAMHLAAEYPQLVRGVFLEDPPIVMPGEQLGGGDQVVDPKELGKMMAKYMRLFKIMPRFIGLIMARKGMAAYPDDEIQPWLDSKRRLSFNFLRSMSTMPMDLSAPFDVIRKIQSPILLIIGDKSKMSIVSPEAAQKAAETNAKLKFIQLEGASHDIRRTRFDGYMPALKDFLAKISMV
ncbi:MAG TPA: alpha/beta hydrolase [Anaerolineaceae bacterium]|nr:alpha/beta hydrolase [Anaerolineaceae bacterium]